MAKNECPHNSGIICPESGRHCLTCGWSAEGAKRRREHAPDKLVVAADPPAPRGNPHCRIVAKVNESGHVLEVYPSIIQAAEANYMAPAVVKNHLKGKLKNPFKCT